MCARVCNIYVFIHVHINIYVCTLRQTRTYIYDEIETLAHKGKKIQYKITRKDRSINYKETAEMTSSELKRRRQE